LKWNPKVWIDVDVTIVIGNKNGKKMKTKVLRLLT
jgi:hypothetical protein